MEKINRRRFLYSGALSLTGLSALSAAGILNQGFAPVNATIDQYGITLGGQGWLHVYFLYAEYDTGH